MQGFDDRIEGLKDLDIIFPVVDGIAEPAQHRPSFFLSAETANRGLVDEFQKLVKERQAEPQPRFDGNIVFAKMLPALCDFAINGLLDRVIKLREAALLLQDLHTDALP